MNQEMSERSEVLLSVNRCAFELGIPSLVVGATARDLLLLEHGRGVPPPSSTLDIDIGVRVSNWADYDRMVDCLLGQAEFGRSEKMVHRLVFRQRTPLDLLPFGAIGGPEGIIVWPKKDDAVFSVVGFEMAYASRLSVRIAGQAVAVASFPAITWLKLEAWHDDPSRTKDLADLWFLVDNYLELVAPDTVYEPNGKDADLLAEESFTTTRAGSRLLGRHMARQGKDAAKRVVGRLLDEKENPKDNLLSAMSTVTPNSVGIEEIRQLFEYLWLGMSDEIP